VAPASTWSCEPPGRVRDAPWTPSGPHRSRRCIKRSSRGSATTRQPPARRQPGRTPPNLDVHAVVDLLGHTRRIGRLANCAEIPGFVQLTEADGTVRLVNPHKAIFEVLVVTEAEAQERARPAGASWDSARGRVVPARWGYGDEDDSPFGDDGEGDEE
jgi:hypothetical protein